VHIHNNKHVLFHFLIKQHIGKKDNILNVNNNNNNYIFIFILYLSSIYLQY